MEGRNSRSHLSLLFRHGSQDCNFPLRLYFSVRLELRADETLWTPALVNRDIFGGYRCMYSHGLRTPRMQQKFQALGFADHSIVSRYSYQKVKNSGQKEDEYAMIVVARACGNMGEVMGRTLDRSEFGTRQKSTP